MKNQTFERFQGLWWGGIVGQALANHKHSDTTTNRLEFPTQNWLRERQQIAQLCMNRAELTGPTFEQPATINSPSAKINHQQQLPQGLRDNDHPLKLLALIFLSEELSTLDVANYTLNSDIWLWHSLIQLILSRNPENLDLASVLKQTPQSLTPSSELLLDLLLLVTKYIERRTSLHQLREELISDAEPQQIAIAYAWYCFLATPQDFKLSVLRAASIDSPLVRITTALTGTLSGAYNGMARIPLSWRSSISQDPNYVREEEVFRELFKTWLGIYDLTSQQDSFNQRIDAVASFSTLQSRKTLKLISQKSV